jgi:hypothetical protein
VGGVIGPPHLPTALVLGRHDHCGRLRVIGRTHPLPRAAREQVGALLRPPARPHPWPTTLPVPAGRFGLPGGDPVEHTAVEPALVVEIETDPNVEGAVIGMARSSCVRGLSWTRDIFRR